MGNAYQVITIILLATTGGIPGFITTRILLQWNVKVGPCNLFGCILAVSAPIHILFFIVTQMKMLHRDWNTTVGFIFISLSLFVINVVTYLAGMFLSTAYPPAERRRTGSQMPYRFSSCMARISANVIACTVVACLQGFGAIGLAYQFVTTPWETRVKQKIGFTLAFSATWLFCGAMLAILASYFIVAKVRNPSWHWSTFFMGALSGVVVFLFSIVYVRFDHLQRPIQHVHHSRVSDCVFCYDWSDIWVCWLVVDVYFLEQRHLREIGHQRLKLFCDGLSDDLGDVLALKELEGLGECLLHVKQASDEVSEQVPRNDLVCFAPIDVFERCLCNKKQETSDSKFHNDPNHAGRHACDHPYECRHRQCQHKH